MSFVKNSVWGGLSAILQMLLSFAATILAIHILGAEEYGYIALISTITGLWLILNNGFYTILVRRIVYQCVEDVSRVYEYRSLGLIYTILSVSIYLLVGMFAENELLGALFNISGEGVLKEAVEAAYEYSLLIIAARLFIAYLVAIFEGFGRFATASKIKMLSPTMLVAGLLIVPLVSEMGLTIDTFFLVYLVAVVSELILASVIMICEKWPKQYKVSRKVGVSSQLLSLVGESMRLQMSSILSMFADPLNKLLINHFVGVSQVTSYELVVKTMLAIRGMFSAAFRAFLQLAPDKNVAADQYRVVLRYIFIPSLILHFMVALVFIGAVTVGAIQVSMDSIYLMLVVMFPSMATVIMAPLYALLVGFGDFRYIMVLHLRLAVINTIVAFALIPVIGVIGAGIGVSIATIYNTYSVFVRFNDNFLVLPGIGEIITERAAVFLYVLLVFVVSGAALLLFREESGLIYYGGVAVGIILLSLQLLKEPLTNKLFHRYMSSG